MLCYVMLCYVMLCYAMLCYSLLCSVMPNSILRDISILKNVIEVLNIEQAKHNIINSSCSFAMRLFPLIIIANIVNILKVQLSKITKLCHT
jgi:hypothetical protein